MRHHEYYPADTILYENRWVFGIRSSVVDRAVKNKIDILAYNRKTEEIMLLTPFDLVFDGTSTELTFYSYQEAYVVMLYDWIPEIGITVDDWEYKLMKRIDPEWINLLHQAIGTNWFKEINRHCNNIERKKYLVRPEKENVFKVFNMRPIDIRVVFCFQDPYPNEHANGLAISTNEKKMPSTLYKIEQAIRQTKEYPKEVELQKNLIHWVNQGIFLYNMALTVRNKEPASHLEYWEPFAESVFKVINNFTKPLVFVLFGSKAYKMKKFISDKHLVLTVEHPAKAAYDEREWEHKDIFNHIDTHLKNNGENPIEWFI